MLVLAPFALLLATLLPAGCCPGDLCACEAEFEDLQIDGELGGEELAQLVAEQGASSFRDLDCDPVCMAVYLRDGGREDAYPRECSVTYQEDGEYAVVDCLVRSWLPCPR